MPLFCYVLTINHYPLTIILPLSLHFGQSSFFCKFAQTIDKDMAMTSIPTLHDTKYDPARQRNKAGCRAGSVVFPAGFLPPRALSAVTLGGGQPVCSPSATGIGMAGFTTSPDGTGAERRADVL